jgi:Phosphatidylethanolamine-binding protein
MKVSLLSFALGSVWVGNLLALVTGGCGISDSIAIVNPSTGFLIAGENCGLEVDKATFREQPFVFYTEALDDMRYTLVMVDNDNPLATDGRIYLHWLATDIEGSSLRHGLGIREGNTVAGEFLFDF